MLQPEPIASGEEAFPKERKKQSRLVCVLHTPFSPCIYQRRDLFPIDKRWERDIYMYGVPGGIHGMKKSDPIHSVRFHTK